MTTSDVFDQHRRSPKQRNPSGRGNTRRFLLIEGSTTSLERTLVMLEESDDDLLVADLNLPDADEAALVHGIQHCRAEQRANTRLLAAVKKESEAVRRLNDIEELKNDFVATVSHELRTPLTSISAYTELLQDEHGLTSQQGEWVDTIARNTFRLTSLTDDLLLLSRFGAPDYVVEAVPVDLTTVVLHAKEVLEAMGAGCDIEMSFELPQAPLVVMGEVEHLERVVLSLMGNAIKFSDSGGTVGCRLSATATEAVIVVTDAGVGIPAAEQTELFTKFFRGAAARDRAIQGTGLGLYIVATIVRNHGGQVSVESGRLSGAAFTVRLPLAAAAGS